MSILLSLATTLFSRSQLGVWDSYRNRTVFPFQISVQDGLRARKKNSFLLLYQPEANLQNRKKIKVIMEIDL